MPHKALDMDFTFGYFEDLVDLNGQKGQLGTDIFNRI